MSVMPSLLRRRACAVVLAVVMAAIVTGCGRHPGPDVIVVAPDDVSLEPDELVAQVLVQSLEWPQTIGLLCNRVDALRSVPDCLVSFGPQIEAQMRSDVALALDVDDAVATFCASEPEATRRTWTSSSKWAPSGSSCSRRMPPPPRSRWLRQLEWRDTSGSSSPSVPTGSLDVAIVAREVIIVYEL